VADSPSEQPTSRVEKLPPEATVLLVDDPEFVVCAADGCRAGAGGITSRAPTRRSDDDLLDGSSVDGVTGIGVDRTCSFWHSTGPCS